MRAPPGRARRILPAARAACLALALGLGAAPAPRAEEVRDAALEARLADARARLAASARLDRERDALVARAEQRLSGLRRRHDARRAELRAERRRLSGLAMALQRLARRPPVAALASPGSPLDAARAAMAIRFMAGRARARTAALSAEVAALEGLRREIDAETVRLAAATAALAERRARLDALVAETAAPRARAGAGTDADSDPAAARRAGTAEAAAALDRLFAALLREEGARRAAGRSLRALLDRAPALADDLPPPPPAAAPPRPEPPAPAPAAAGTDAAAPPVPPAPAAARAAPAPEGFADREPIAGALAFPVAGRVVRRFGAPDGPGRTYKGIAVAARPGARVVAPLDGEAIFAGPFRRYGRIIIVEHAGGFHTLLAGLGRIDVRPGQKVLAGEPVGAMGAASGGGERPRLHVELRRDGAPVDPLAWLSARRETVKR